MKTEELRTPAVVLRRVPGASGTGAPRGDWHDVQRVWCRLDVLDSGTGESTSGPGVKATQRYRVRCRWWAAWADVLRPDARLRIGAVLYDVRSAVDLWAGGEREIHVQAEAVVS